MLWEESCLLAVMEQDGLRSCLCEPVPLPPSLGSLAFRATKLAGRLLLQLDFRSDSQHVGGRELLASKQPLSVPALLS